MISSSADLLDIEASKARDVLKACPRLEVAQGQLAILVESTAV
jgi:hypothetical protein